MDTKAGQLVEFDNPRAEPMPPNLNAIRYGQVVEVVGVGHFEITKIELLKQRLVLKPIPSPA